MADETDIERAEELAEETAEGNPDETTRREALELKLKDEGISEAGTAVDETTTSSERSNP
jgi:hypothetical protein